MGKSLLSRRRRRRRRARVIYKIWGFKIKRESYPLPHV
jgi:hypothetical protein